MKRIYKKPKFPDEWWTLFNLEHDKEVREVSCKRNDLYEITTSEQDIYLKYPDGRREYSYTHRWISKQLLALHIGGPKDGQHLPEEINDEYISFNKATRDKTHSMIRVHKSLLNR